MMQPPWKTPYRPRWTPLIFGGVFFSLCAASLGWQAATNERGLVLNGIITFSAHGASVFYLVLSGSSALFVIMAVFVALASVRSSVFLELTVDALVIPRGFAGKKFRRISYSEISSISELSVAGTKSLGIRTATGQYWIPSSVLPSSEVYQELKRFLTTTASSNQTMQATAATPRS